MNKKTPIVVQIDIFCSNSEVQTNSIKESLNQKYEVKETIDLKRNISPSLKGIKKNNKEFKNKTPNFATKQSRNKGIEANNKTASQRPVPSSVEKKVNKKYQIDIQDVEKNINSLYSACSSLKMTSPINKDCNSNKKPLKKKANKLSIRKESIEKIHSSSKSKLTLFTHRHKLNLTNNMLLQSNPNQISDLKSKRSRSYTSSKETPKAMSESKAIPKHKRINFYDSLGESESRNQLQKKTIEKPNNSSTEIYRRKLIREFKKVLNQLNLQEKLKANYEELKMILGKMKMINTKANCKKWERMLGNVWEVLSMKQDDLDQVSMNGIKNFILGVCGIDYQEMYEISEIESTPSASTKESKISDEFIFNSVEHLVAIRLQFYEMILHKLTYSKDINEGSETPIMKSKTFHQESDDIKTIQLEVTGNKTPEKRIPKIETISDNIQPSTPSSVVFKRSALDSPTIEGFNTLFCNKESDVEQESYKKEEPEPHDQTPILSFNVHIGHNEIKEFNIYSKETMYKEAVDFCKLYNLPDEKFDLLISILNDEAQNMLTRIDEEDEDFD